MLLVIACVPVAVHLYEAPVLYSILPIMALGMPLSALSIVPAAALRAALNFRFIATYSAIELAVGQVFRAPPSQPCGRPYSGLSPGSKWAGFASGNSGSSGKLPAVNLLSSKTD